MKVYVVDSFIRDEENLEFQSGIEGVYQNVEDAINFAKNLKNDNFKYYENAREDDTEGSLKYYCCLDADPDGNSEYANYMVITVTENEVKSSSKTDNKSGLVVKVTEKCLTTDNNGKECYSLRYYKYQTTKHNFLDAINEIENNFDCDNILANTSNDEFEGECLDSTVIKYELVEE